MTGTENGDVAAAQRRSIAILLGGVVAAACAVLSIVGPANHETTRISWPSDAQEMMGPSPVGTPILLAERQPESFSTRIPCAAMTAPTVSTADRRILLSTARRPGPIDALVIAAVDDEVRVAIGTKIVARAVVDPSSGCEVLVSCADGAWSLMVNGAQRATWRDTAPVMSGLYTDVPPSSAGASAPKVELTTYPQTSSPSRQQWIWMAAALMAGSIVVLSIVKADRASANAPSRWRRWRPPPIRRMDAAMFSLIAAWGVLAGPQSDDGWVMSTVANQRASGSFGNYFDAMNANLTLGYLHDLLFHVMSAVSQSIMWFRVPVIVAWCVIWYLSRSLFDRWADDVGAAPNDLRWGRFTLSAMFLLSIVSVGISIRPEFLTGLGVMVVALLAERFRRRPSVALVVAMTVVVAVAVSIHTVGVVSLAPVVVVVPSIWRWLRADRSGGLFRVAGGALVAAAVGLLLVFADTDTQLYRRSLDLTELTGVHNGGLLSEWKRYDMLFDVGWGLTSLRLFVVTSTVASVGLLIVRIVTRRRDGADRPRLEFQKWWLIGTMLLAVVPSKWPVHFAALTGLGALAVSTAVVQVLAVSSAERRTRPAPQALRAGVAAVGAGALAYLVFAFRVSPELWVNDSTSLSSIIDKQRFAARAGAVIGVVSVCAWTARSLRRTWSVADWWRLVVGRVPAILAVGVTVSIIGAGVGALFAPSGWSMGRQNLGLSGECGLASRLDVADPDHVTDLPILQSNEDPTPVGMDDVRLPNGRQGWRDGQQVKDHAGRVEGPWQALDATGFAGIWMSGQWWSDHETTLVLEFGHREGNGVLAVERVRYQPFRSAFADPDRWRLFIAQVPPLEADAVRVVVDDTTKRTGWMGLSVVVGIGSVPLDQLLRTSDEKFLLDVSTVPFMPCAPRPSIVRGVSELPDHAIEPGFRNGVGLTIFGRSPFFMQADAFEVPYDILPTVFSRAPESEYPGALIVTARPSLLAPFDSTGIDLD